MTSQVVLRWVRFAPGTAVRIEWSDGSPTGTGLFVGRGDEGPEESARAFARSRRWQVVGVFPERGDDEAVPATSAAEPSALNEAERAVLAASPLDPNVELVPLRWPRRRPCRCPALALNEPPVLKVLHAPECRRRSLEPRPTVGPVPGYDIRAALIGIQRDACPCCGCALSEPGELSFRPCAGCGCAWRLSTIAGRQYPGVVRPSGGCRCTMTGDGVGTTTTGGS